MCCCCDNLSLVLHADDDDVYFVIKRERELAPGTVVITIMPARIGGGTGDVTYRSIWARLRTRNIYRVQYRTQ